MLRVQIYLSTTQPRMTSRSMNEGAAARYRLTDTDAHVSRVDLTDLAEAEKKLRKLRENKDVATDLDLAEQLKADRTKSKKAKGDGEKDEKDEKDEKGGGDSKEKAKGDGEDDEESFDEEEEA